jgi:hypothetical protein
VPVVLDVDDSSNASMPPLLNLELAKSPTHNFKVDRLIWNDWRFIQVVIRIAPDQIEEDRSSRASLFGPLDISSSKPGQSTLSASCTPVVVLSCQSFSISWPTVVPVKPTPSASSSTATVVNPVLRRETSTWHYRPCH